MRPMAPPGLVCRGQWPGPQRDRRHPAERLIAERALFRPLPSLRPPLRAGEPRKVDRTGMIRFGPGATRWRGSELVGGRGGAGRRGRSGDQPARPGADSPWTRRPGAMSSSLCRPYAERSGFNIFAREQGGSACGLGGPEGSVAIEFMALSCGLLAIEWGQSCERHMMPKFQRHFWLKGTLKIQRRRAARTILRWTWGLDHSQNDGRRIPRSPRPRPHRVRRAAETASGVDMPGPTCQIELDSLQCEESVKM